MVAATFELWLLFKGRTPLLLVLSGGLWALAQTLPGPTQVPWQVSGSNAFDLAAWQLLFFAGMAIGYHRDALAKKLAGMPRLPYFLVITGLFILLLKLHDTNGAFLTRLIPGLDAPALLAG